MTGTPDPAVKTGQGRTRLSGPRKYAVQKPKGSKWETLALVDDLSSGKQAFHSAVSQHAAVPVRLIQVDFINDDALSDFDWRLIELHDPRSDTGGRPKPTIIAGSERTQPRKAAKRPARRGTGLGGSGGLRPPGQPPLSRGQSERVPVPVPTYVAAFLFGAAALILWAVWFRI